MNRTQTVQLLHKRALHISKVSVLQSHTKHLRFKMDSGLGVTGLSGTWEDNSQKFILLLLMSVKIRVSPLKSVSI